MKTIHFLILLAVGLVNILMVIPAPAIVIVNTPTPTPMTAIVTAYTLRPQETDSTPCETALGKSVNICQWAKRDQLCATWLYPLLTRLKIGDVECIVVDRTARKYSNRIDLIMPTVQEARQFGIQELPVEVIQ